jgi:hypothetical protein
MEFRNVCGDCNDTGYPCYEFALDENQSNRNMCCCGHKQNMHKSAPLQWIENFLPKKKLQGISDKLN